MGIQRLKTLLDDEIIATDLFREELPINQPKHLLIDASNFFYQVLDERSIPNDFRPMIYRDHSGLTDSRVIQSLSICDFEVVTTVLPPDERQISPDFVPNLDSTLQEFSESDGGHFLSWEEFEELLSDKYKILEESLQALPPFSIYEIKEKIVYDIDNFYVFIYSQKNIREKYPLVVLQTGSQLDKSRNIQPFLKDELAGHAIPLVNNSDSGLLDRRYCGTYDEMIAIFENEIQELQSLGFKLHFFFDNNIKSQSSTEEQLSLHSFKDYQSQKRKNYQVDSWNALKLIIEDQSRTFSQKKLPLPPKTFQILTKYLLDNADRLNINIDNRSGEADPRIHEKCTELASQMNKELFYVYSYDT